MDDAKLTPHLRLFGLLALLVPLFLGLQYVVREGVPRVEVRLVPQDVQTTVPVEVPVERVVERVVYVPVDRETSQPVTRGTDLAQTGLPITSDLAAQPEGRPSDEPPAVAVASAPDAAPSVASAEPEATTAPLAGTVALAPPAPAPVVAAPVVARAVPVAPVYFAPVEEEVAEEAEADEFVAEAEAPADDWEPVAEAADEAAEEVAVVQFVSEQPVVREDDGPSISMLRHELAVREARPVVVEAAPVEEEAAPVATDEAPAPSEGEIAEEPEAVSEPVAEGDEVVAEARPVSSAELLEHAKPIKTEVLDHGSQNEQSLGVLEGQLAARPAGPAPAQEDEEAEAAAEPEGEVVVAEADADGPSEADEPDVAEAEGPADLDEAAWSEGAEGAGEEPAAIDDGGAPEVARTEEAPAVEEEPEQ